MWQNLFTVYPAELSNIETDKYDNLVLYSSQKRYALWTNAEYITTKRTKHQLSVYVKMPIVRRFCHACLTFQFRGYTVTEGFANKAIKRIHTIATQINIGNYRPYYDIMLVPALNADTEMTLW